MSTDFTITISPSSRTISRGMTGCYNLVIKSVNGFYYSRSSWNVTGHVVVPLPENGGPFMNVTVSSQGAQDTYNYAVTTILSGRKATKTIQPLAL